MAKVIFEFDYYEDREEVKAIHNIHNTRSALDEIYNLVRNELKHGQEELSDHINELLERIQEEAAIIFDE